MEEGHEQGQEHTMSRRKALAGIGATIALAAGKKGPGLRPDQELDLKCV